MKKDSLIREIERSLNPDCGDLFGLSTSTAYTSTVGDNTPTAEEILKSIEGALHELNIMKPPIAEPPYVTLLKKYMNPLPFNRMEN